MKEILKTTAVFFSRLIPIRWWSGLEYAAAYFQGKGSGSNSLDEEVSAAAKIVSGDGLVILDIGANRGDWAEKIMALLGNRIEKLYLFEPSPHNISLLKEKFGNNQKVRIVPKAISDKEGERDLFFDTPGSGMASLHKRKLDHFGVSLNQSAKVTTTTIDSFLSDQGIKKVDFMKMDIEGHELSAFRGAEDAFREKKIRGLSFEFGGANIDSRTFFQDFWYLLTKRGYHVSRISFGGSIISIEKYSEILENFRTTNYIAYLS